MIDEDEMDVMEQHSVETAEDGMEEYAEAAETEASGKPDLNLIMDIPVTMQVVLGTAVMPVSTLVKLGRGAVVKLDTNIGDPVDLIVNGRIVARGEVVVLENEESRFGITLTEIVSPGAKPQRAKASNS
jgi:flagellar motor switch protein FliN/FliY